MAGWTEWAAAHPGRITHPDPSNFMGATFLKQALVELAPRAPTCPLPTDDTFAKATAPLGTGMTRCARIYGAKGGPFRE
ncbi:hypothetical protein FLP41_04210 [Paracoccus marcusii]|uniref:hypothetical protein n=1 Tax=Paracoccus marcusii TaxID=59779 RepID=UPI002ED37EE3|nr:hypothetical protein FLP41_04210 [Paracoccus marcusii]